MHSSTYLMREAISMHSDARLHAYLARAGSVAIADEGGNQHAFRCTPPRVLGTRRIGGDRLVRTSDQILWGEERAS